MVKLKEADIQRQILEWLEYSGIFAIRVNNMGIPLGNGKYRPPRRRGIPDIFAIIPRKRGFGIPLFIEVKGPKGKMSPEQEQFFTDADHAGALCLEARSVDFVKEQLQPYLKPNF